MAISPKASKHFTAKGQLQSWCWSNVGAADELTPLEVNFETATAQVLGEFGAASVVLEGSLDGATFGSMPRALGDASAVKDSGLVRLLGPATAIRPRLVGADDTTRLTIIIAAVQA